jgi:hypothetical protein
LVALATAAAAINSQRLPRVKAGVAAQVEHRSRNFFETLLMSVCWRRTALRVGTRKRDGGISVLITAGQMALTRIFSWQTQ